MKAATFSIAAAAAARSGQPEQHQLKRSVLDYVRDQKQPVSRDQNAARVGALIVQDKQQGEGHGKSYA